ncbi:myb/SANT-like DNA-binding domain-containing protein 2 [Ctenopharyngodon idella]|uniref:myb/SANT-like DNA-binding domain-containing protein 2 n=1 Tax=Ctenopharyngodon idella TaxID=7959 RepID=UPI002231376D|nr:myb/SANT-like DNA-binding domain-containing protein 2 [Ctenopharyngodon idella]
MAAAGRGVLWTDEETTALLQIWKEDYIKQQLSTTHRNTKVFLQFSAKMRDRRYNRTDLQCRITVKKLRQKYMAIRDKLRCSGQSADVKWPVYDLLDEILGTSPCANPLNAIDGRSFDMEDEDENATDDDNNNNHNNSSSISIDNSSIPSTESAVETSDEGTSSSHPLEAKRKTSKSNQEEKKSFLQQITTLILSVIEQQKKDHHLFLLKEEERHQRELELERERYKLQMELEERRRRAQEHDQAMMRMLCQVMNSAVTNTFPPIHTPLYPTEESSFHTLPVIHQPSASVTGQGVSSTSSSEQTLSAILHELSNSDK